MSRISPLPDSFRMDLWPEGSASIYASGGRAYGFDWNKPLTALELKYVATVPRFLGLGSKQVEKRTIIPVREQVKT